MDYGKIMQAINASPLPTRTPHGWTAVPLGVAHSNIDTVRAGPRMSGQMHESEDG